MSHDRLGGKWWPLAMVTLPIPPTTSLNIAWFGILWYDKAWQPCLGAILPRAPVFFPFFPTIWSNDVRCHLPSQVLGQLSFLARCSLCSARERWAPPKLYLISPLSIGILYLEVLGG